MPIYDFHIYVSFHTDFGIYSILEHKNHKNQYNNSIDNYLYFLYTLIKIS